MSTLQGLKVLDFGRYVAGPYTATLLADFGADVIRIERLTGGEDRGVAPVTAHGDGSLFLQMGRNKRSVALKLGSPEAKEIIEKLVAEADVVVANVPTGALAKMGLDYATLSSIKPDIILANATAFGHQGPWSERPGFDSVGQAMCGSAYLSGSGEVPVRTPTTWVDHATALYLALGILVALIERDRTGRGQLVEASLLGTAVGINSTSIIEQAIAAPDRVATGNRSALNGPTDIFQTRDGWLLTQVVGDVLFKRWAGLMAEDHWCEDPRFATDELRGQHGDLLSARMAAWCKDRTNDEALDALGEAMIPAAPILSPQAVLEHPQVDAMKLLIPTLVQGLAEKAPLVRTPVELSISAPTIRSPSPLVGEHNDEILGALGYSTSRIAELRTAGIVGA